MTKIGVLTSSRADYSLYRPLLEEIRSATDWSCDILAFGTHLSSKYGYTANEITKDGFTIGHGLHTMPDDDSPGGVSRSMAKTITAFSGIWEKESYDLLIALGDRFEMFAAVASAVPFNIRVGHISGGETTLGAIDDAFRHSISHMSQIHFTATEAYRQRVIELLGFDRGVHNTGALGVDNLSRAKWIGREEFQARWAIDLTEPFILITMHPETVSFERNQHSIKELLSALRKIRGYRFVITMPNADTMGGMIRDQWRAFAAECPLAHLVENFGTEGYMTAMKHCSLMLGNTSSGFVEAEFFPKPVVNLGERQRGRIITENITNCPFEAAAIVEAVGKAAGMNSLKRTGIYGNGSAAHRIVRLIADYLAVPLHRS